MSPFYKLGVVNHPEAAEVILVSHKTLVERQIGANGVLQGAGRKREKEGKINNYSDNLVINQRRYGLRTCYVHLVIITQNN